MEFHYVYRLVSEKDPRRHYTDYRWSSYWYLNRPKLRPAFLDPTGALREAGGLSDTSPGRKSYGEYLEWLSTDGKARKEMGFEKMCRGWALGSKEFKRSLLESEGLLKEGSFGRLRMEGGNLREANELIRESVLSRGLEAAGKDAAAIETDKKSAEWKIRIAAKLKQTTGAPSTWIA